MKDFSRILMITASAFFLIMGIWFLFSYDYSSFQEIIKSWQERKILENEYQVEKEKLKKIQEIFEAYHSYLPTQEKISLLLPEKIENGELVYQLEGLADFSNVELIKASFNEIKTEKKGAAYLKKEKKLIKDLGIISVNLEVEGDYPSLKEFLRKIETNIRVMDVKRMELYKAGKGLAANLTLYLYYQKH